VVYQGATPKFTQQGPYVYQESNSFTDIEWTTRTDNQTGIDQSVVLANFNQYTNFTPDSSENQSYDTQMWIVNQAAIKMWYSMNN
jgi:ABC-type transport system involved in Fe-S cluster assembly fused permease/ATPase subunit